MGNKVPRMGQFVPGQLRFKRIRIDIAIPTTTAVRASMMYWMPITLWSRLKMYLRMKLFGGSCRCTTSWVTSAIAFSSAQFRFQKT